MVIEEGENRGAVDSRKEAVESGDERRRVSGVKWGGWRWWWWCGGGAGHSWGGRDV